MRYASAGMKILEFLKSRLHGVPPVTPVERILAKRWVKERLKRLFPELRHDPKALEEAYQALSLEPQPGAGKGGSMLFEVVLPGKIE
jgi:hypothetical protein